MNARVTFAKKIGDILRNSKDIDILLIEGSVALGYDDKSSDVDLIAFCTKIPDTKELSRLLGMNKIELHSRHPGSQMYFNLDYSGSINFVNISFLSDKINKYPDVDSDEYHHLTRFLLRTKLVFDKTSKFKEWQKKVSVLPKNLKRDILLQNYDNLAHFFLTDKAIDNSLNREDIVHINHIFTTQTKNFLSMIYALNGLMLVHIKWAYKDLDELKIKPPKFSKNMHEIVLKGNSKKDVLTKIKIFQEWLRWAKSYVDKFNSQK